MMQANDDGLFRPEATWVRFTRLTAAGAPFEVHHFAKGGHGFGMGVYGGAAAGWPAAFAAWMRDLGLLG